MKKIFLLLSILLVTGCTTIQTKASGNAFLKGVNPDKAYTIAIRSASSAGLTIIDTDKDSGIITATRGANRFLTWSDPVVNILVTGDSKGSDITISSVVGGQVIDYGTTAHSVQDFCASLNKLHPAANCK